MLTIVCDNPGTLSARRTNKPLRGENDVLVRVRRVGVCGTDMHIFTGNQPYLSFPHVMGHELSGTVEEVPPGSSLSAGDQVYLMPYLSCGQCSACRQGKTNCCRNIQVLGVYRDGGMTEYLNVPQGFVQKAEGISLDQAAMINFLSIGAHAVRRSGIEAGQRVLVAGAGPIGMAVAVFAKLKGENITVLDTRADRLAFCQTHLGIEAVVRIGLEDTERLSSLTGGDLYDIVSDATGNPKAMERGFQFIAHGGTYVLVSIVSSDITFSDPEFHKREATLTGSRNATFEDFETVVAAMRAGQIPTAALNTHKMNLADVPSDFAKLLDPASGVVKAIIEV